VAIEGLGMLVYMQYAVAFYALCIQVPDELLSRPHHSDIDILIPKISKSLGYLSKNIDIDLGQECYCRLLILISSQEAL